MPRSPFIMAAVAASAVVLAGCSTTGADASSDDRISVVASTDVYGQIAQQIGGDAIDVTSLITSGGQDPHGYEASARDQLTVTRADLIIENGSGYDAFVDALVDATGTDAPVITAVEYSPEWHDDPAGFNEHVWYDPATMAAVAAAITDELATLDPASVDSFRANAAAFTADTESLESSLADIGAAHPGEQIFVTEPVPLYLTDAAGLDNVTPEAFSQAVEEGQDVPPATLLESLDLLASGDVRVVIVNAQTGGAETTRVVGAAHEAGIPVLEFTETLPKGETYISWMRANVEQLAEALGA